MHEDEFDAAVDRAARALLASVNDAGAEPATASALMNAVQIHANRFDGLLPVEDIEGHERRCRGAGARQICGSFRSRA